MKNKILLVVFGFALLLGCAEPPDKNTQIFSNYISKEFGISIPDSLHYYILLPNLACKGCSAGTLAELDDLVTPKNEHFFTFISTNEHAIPPGLKIAKFFQYDTHGRLNDLDLDIANVTIIKTMKQRVVFIKPVYLDEKRSLSEIITF